MATNDDAANLAQVLDGLTYPAAKWQITTCAELYGAGAGTMRRLYDLPARTYESAADIAGALPAPGSAQAAEPNPPARVAFPEFAAVRATRPAGLRPVVPARGSHAGPGA